MPEFNGGKKQQLNEDLGKKLDNIASNDSNIHKKGFLPILVFMLIIVSVLWGTDYLQFDYQRLVEGTFEMFKIFKLMIPPDLTEWRDVFEGLLETFQIAWLGTIIASIIAFLLCFLGAANVSPMPLLVMIVRGFAAIMRAIPALVWALIFVAALGLGPLPGILAIGIHGTGMQIRVFSDSIEEIDSGILEALKASGANWFQMISRGVLPAIWPSLLGWFLLRLDIDLRYSSVMGIVGAGGIGWLLTRAMRMYQFKKALFIVIVIFSMLFLIERLNVYIKSKVLRLH